MVLCWLLKLHSATAVRLTLEASDVLVAGVACAGAPLLQEISSCEPSAAHLAIWASASAMIWAILLRALGVCRAASACHLETGRVNGETP